MDMNVITTSASTYWPISKPVTIHINYDEMKHNYFPPSTCDRCSNNPKNGGSGICFCIIGTPQITC